MPTLNSVKLLSSDATLLIKRQWMRTKIAPRPFIRAYTVPRNCETLPRTTSGATLMKLRLLPALGALCLFAASGVGSNAQWVVHDPVNGVTLVDQKLTQMRQLATQVQQLQNELRNLTPYSTDWSSIMAQVTALRAQIARNAPTIDNANTQLAQMGAELSTLQQLQAMSNNARGSMQATQTTNSLLATLIGQIQKQRALTLNSIREEEQDKRDAYAAIYGPSQLAK